MTLLDPNEPNDDEVHDAELVDESTGGIVPVGDVTPEQRFGGVNEWSDVSSGDLSPEEVTSLTMIPMNAKLDGGFTDLDTGEAGILELDFVWLAKQKQRAAFIKVDDNGKISRREFDAKNPTGPDCRSFDGRTADKASPLLQNGGDCTTCPLARWVDGETLCKDSVVAMAAIPDEKGVRLASLRFKGISVSTAKAYWRSFDERLPVIPPIAFVTHVALEPEDTDNGKFLQAKFSRNELLTRKEAQALIDERERRVAGWQQLIEEEVRADTGGEGNGPFDGDTAATTYAAGEEEF